MASITSKRLSLLSQTALSDQRSVGKQILFVLIGTALLSALAQIKIPLPFTPVPITGQTFGVALIALTWGRLAPWTMAAYLLIGFMGAPVFSQPPYALQLGPTFGYLMGMMVASLVVGQLTERGWLRGFWSALGLAYIGSFCIFGVGLAVLGHFVGYSNVFALGLFPFLPGDLIKNVCAAALASRAYKSKR